MRLICPSCDAQYEVADAAIPPGGRNVQCSNCDHTWFFASHPPAEQPGGLAEPGPVRDTSIFGGRGADIGVSATPVTAGTTDGSMTAAAVPVGPGPDAVGAARTGGPDDEHPPGQPQGRPRHDEVAADHGSGGDDTGVDDRQHDDDVDDDGDGQADDATMRGDAGASTPPRRTVGADVMAVLRDEADREAQARRAETEPLAAVARGYAPPTGRVPRSASAPVAAQVRTGEAHSRAARFDAAPGNAFADTRAFADPVGFAGFAEPEPTGPVRRRSGFATGFLVVVLVTALLAGAYVAAPAISAQVPAAASALQQYVAFVDTARVRLDSTAQDAMALFEPSSGADSATAP